MYDWPSFEELAELENYSRAWYHIVNTWDDYMVFDPSGRDIDNEGDNNVESYQIEK